jgi:hypothetical protein
MRQRLVLAFVSLSVAACSSEGPSASPGGTPENPGSDAASVHEAAPAVDHGAPPEGEDAEATQEASTGVPDTGGATDDGGGSLGEDAAGPGPEAGPPKQYACTLLIGINATGEWYKQGYEDLVDNDRWELMQIHNGFIEKWADPNDAYWSTAIYSPCPMNPKAPDRIIFVLSNFDYTTIEQWYPPLQAVLKNLQDKYPSAKNIELSTWVRAPGNMACPQAPAPRSAISAGEDAAIAKAVQDYPNLVTAAPKFEAHACSEYTDNPPHPTAAGGAAWAKMIAAYYQPKL